jgi:hypothetical protein
MSDLTREGTYVRPGVTLGPPPEPDPVKEAEVRGAREALRAARGAEETQKRTAFDSANNIAALKAALRPYLGLS